MIIQATILLLSSLAPGFVCADTAAVVEGVAQYGQPSVLNNLTYAEYYWMPDDDLHRTLHVWWDNETRTCVSHMQEGVL